MCELHTRAGGRQCLDMSFFGHVKRCERFQRSECVLETGMNKGKDGARANIARVGKFHQSRFRAKARWKADFNVGMDLALL